MRPPVVASGAWPSHPPAHVVTSAACGVDDDAQLWTGGEDGGIVRWSLGRTNNQVPRDDPTPVAFLSGHTDRVNALCVLRDGVVVSAGDDGVVCAWSASRASPCVSRRAMGRQGCRITALCILHSSLNENAMCVAAACVDANGAATIALLDPRTLRTLNLEAPLEAPSTSLGPPVSLACRKPKREFTSPGVSEWEWEGDLVAMDAAGNEVVWAGPGRRRASEGGGGSEPAASGTSVPSVEVSAAAIAGLATADPSDPSADPSAATDATDDATDDEDALEDDVHDAAGVVVCTCSTGDTTIEVTRAARVTVTSKSGEVVGGSSLAASWFGRGLDGRDGPTADAVTATCFIGGGALAPAYLATGHADGDVTVESLPTGTGGATCVCANGQKHDGKVTCAAECDGRLVTGATDRTVRIWSVDGSACELKLGAVLRHHSRVVRTILPAPAGFSDENKFIFTVDAGGSVGLVDVAAGRCELTIPGAGDREERLVELMLDVTKGALALRYEGGRASDGLLREVKCKDRVDVWDLAGAALDRSVRGDIANALVVALGPTCHRARASGHPAWSQPARAGDGVTNGVTKALRNRRPISGDWTQSGAPYLLVNASALLLGGCGRGLAGEVDGKEAARALRLVVAASHAWGRDADVDDAARRALRGEEGEGEGGGASESFDGFGKRSFADRTTDAVVGAGGAVTLASPNDPREIRTGDLEESTRRALALDATCVRLAELVSSEAIRGDIAKVRDFNSTSPLHLATLARQWQAPCGPIRESARSLFRVAAARALPESLRERPPEGLMNADPEAFGLGAWAIFEPDADAEEFDPRRSSNSPLEPFGGARRRGSLGVCVAAAACLANPRGVHPTLPALVIPALRELMRGSMQSSLISAAAALLSEGIGTARWLDYAGMGDAARMETLDEAIAIVEALSAGMERSVHAVVRPSSAERRTQTLTRFTTGSSPRHSRSKVGSPASSQPSTPKGTHGSPTQFSPRVSNSAAEGGYDAEVLGTPAERMMARDALSSLLSSIASSSPRAYAVHLLRRLRTADPQSHSHVVSLMALARVARETPAALAPHVPALMDAVLFSLQPSNASLRRNCLVGSTALVSELASRLPTVAYHRRTTRLAVAVDPAPAGGTVAIVYDLTAAATWRTLIDRDEGTGDDTAVSWMDGWTNTIASYAGSKDATSSPTSGGSPTFFNSGRRSARTSRSSRDGAAAGDSPLSPEARTARANAAMAAIPTPETPEQQIAAAAAAAAAAMLQSRRDSFDGGSTTTTPRASQSHSVASAGGTNDHSRITAMAWDEKGERLAAFSDRIRRVHVWNVSAGSGKSLLPSLFARSIQGTASEVGYSHGVPCVVPVGGGDGTGLGESHGSRLDWKDGQTVTIWRGGVAVAFRVGE